MLLPCRATDSAPRRDARPARETHATSGRRSQVILRVPRSTSRGHRPRPTSPGTAKRWSSLTRVEAAGALPRRRAPNVAATPDDPRGAQQSARRRLPPDVIGRDARPPNAVVSRRTRARPARQTRVSGRQRSSASTPEGRTRRWRAAAQRAALEILPSAALIAARGRPARPLARPLHAARDICILRITLSEESGGASPSRRREGRRRRDRIHEALRFARCTDRRGWRRLAGRARQPSPLLLSGQAVHRTICPAASRGRRAGCLSVPWQPARAGSGRLLWRSAWLSCFGPIA